MVFLTVWPCISLSTMCYIILGVGAFVLVKQLLSLKTFSTIISIFINNHSTSKLFYCRIQIMATLVVIQCLFCCEALLTVPGATSVELMSGMLFPMILHLIVKLKQFTTFLFRAFVSETLMAELVLVSPRITVKCFPTVLTPVLAIWVAFLQMSNESLVSLCEFLACWTTMWLLL